MEMTKEYPKRKGLKSGVRTEFTVLANLKSGHENAVRETIQEYGSHPGRLEAIRALSILHEARFVVLDNGTRLLFCSSFDGPWDKYIDDASTTIIATLFDAVWSHTEGYPGMADLDRVKDWFMSHAVEAISFTSDYPDVTVKEIGKALAVQQAFQQVLDDPETEQVLKSPVLKPLLDQAAT